MSRIYHIAVKVDDLERAKAFYKDVFGFTEVHQHRVRDHVSCHLTDGVLDFALIKYDSEDVPEADWSGPGPCIHHFGVQVDEMESAKRRLAAQGCQILSQPDVLPVKFRTPEGVVAEISPPGHFDKLKRAGTKRARRPK